MGARPNIVLVQTAVIGVHVGYVDTDASARLDVPEVLVDEAVAARCRGWVKTGSGYVSGWSQALDQVGDEENGRDQSVLASPMMEGWTGAGVDLRYLRRSAG